MRAVITEEGLVFGSRFPGFGRTILFDEMTGAECLENNGPPLLIIHRENREPKRLKGLPVETARTLASDLREILTPAVSRSDSPLPPRNLDEILEDLTFRKGARPSVILGFIIDQAFLHRATDIHFESIRGKYRLRFRIDGILRDMAEIQEALRSRLVAHMKNRAGLASYRKDIPQEGRFSHILDSRAENPLELRLSTAPTREAETVVLRLFTAMGADPELLDLGFSESMAASYLDVLTKPHGMILLSGPGGSGKTTTIYATLRHLMNGSRKGGRAASLEDPVEYPLDCVSQIQVNESRGLTFDVLLSKILRQDVEIIAIGEIRDDKTAAAAFRAALTGHLVLSTIHSASAADTPRRLADLGVPPTETAEALSAVISQRLVRMVCENCKTQAEVTPDLRQAMNIPESMTHHYFGAGCHRCLDTGSYGRTAVGEIMVATENVKDLIRKSAPGREIHASVFSKTPDIRLDAMKKAEAGITALNEIKRVLG